MRLHRLLRHLLRMDSVGDHLLLTLNRLAAESAVAGLGELLRLTERRHSGVLLSLRAVLRVLQWLALDRHAWDDTSGVGRVLHSAYFSS